MTCLLQSLKASSRSTQSCIYTVSYTHLDVYKRQVLEERDLAVSFRSYCEKLSLSNIVCANAMVQIAVNMGLKEEAPKFNKKKFESAVEFALTQTRNRENFLSNISQTFLEAGVVLVVLPNLKNSGINGATKKLGGKILMMVNDRRHYADTFWFTLFHEIGHVMNGDYGITFTENKNESEDEADIYAQNKLIPQQRYIEFLRYNEIFTEKNIRDFADSINQDPGIIFGRLQNDGKIPFTETELAGKLRYKYKIQARGKD